MPTRVLNQTNRHRLVTKENKSAKISKSAYWLFLFSRAKKYEFRRFVCIYIRIRRISKYICFRITKIVSIIVAKRGRYQRKRATVKMRLVDYFRPTYKYSSAYITNRHSSLRIDMRAPRCRFLALSVLTSNRPCERALSLYIMYLVFFFRSMISRYHRSVGGNAGAEKKIAT